MKEKRSLANETSNELFNYFQLIFRLCNIYAIRVAFASIVINAKIQLIDCNYT